MTIPLALPSPRSSAMSSKPPCTTRARSPNGASASRPPPRRRRPGRCRGAEVGPGLEEQAGVPTSADGAVHDESRRERRRAARPPPGPSPAGGRTRPSSPVPLVVVSSRLEPRAEPASSPPDEQLPFGCLSESTRWKRAEWGLHRAIRGAGVRSTASSCHRLLVSGRSASRARASDPESSGSDSEPAASRPRAATSGRPPCSSRHALRSQISIRENTPATITSLVEAGVLPQRLRERDPALLVRGDLAGAGEEDPGGVELVLAASHLLEDLAPPPARTPPSCTPRGSRP